MDKCNKVKVENWLGNEIRFVEIDGEWWAVLKDVANTLSIVNSKDLKSRLDIEWVGFTYLPHPQSKTKKLKVTIVNELGIYDCVIRSNKPEAKEFKKWIYSLLKELRKQNDLQGFEVFRMLDKEHQKEAMAKLRATSVEPIEKINYIKANTITDKAVSNMYNIPKMVKKGMMTPEMLQDRQKVLEKVVKLMEAQLMFNLDISVSKVVYENIKEEI